MDDSLFLVLLFLGWSMILFILSFVCCANLAISLIAFVFTHLVELLLFCFVIWILLMLALSNFGTY